MAGLVCLGLVAGLEVGFRLLEPSMGVDRGRIRDYRHFLVHGGLRVFEPRAHTVYQRPRSTPCFNSLGFRDREWSLAKTPGVPRILCLGSSTTEGGNASGLRGSYPFLLERTLESRTGRDFEVLNAGIGGWTSAEELVAWFLTLQDYAPDLVVLHEGVNDLQPRFRADFRPDYSHWRRPIGGSTAGWIERFVASWSDLYLHVLLERGKVPDIFAVSTSAPRRLEPLMKQGKLPPETARPFRRNVASIAASARSAGAEIALMTMPLKAHQMAGDFWESGAAQHNQHLRELAAEEGCLLVDAAAAFAARPELQAEFLDIVHLTPQGNAVKARLVAEVLCERWIPGLPAEGARTPRGAGNRAPE